MKESSDERARSGRPSFGFRLKFQLSSGRTFHGVRPIRRLYFGGVKGRIYLQKMRQPKRHRFGARTKHAIIGKGFDTYAAAFSCGTKLKCALALLAVELRIGLDVGNDRATSASGKILKDLAAQHGFQLRDDVHGLDVYSEHPPVQRFGIEAYGSSKHVIDDYAGKLRDLYAAPIAFTPKQQLSINLYNLSHFESKSETRFLMLVTIVEILSTRSNRSTNVRLLLRELKAKVDLPGLTKEERKQLKNGLGNLNQQSIGEACKDLVTKYFPPEQISYFSNCYKARCELVHDGKTSRSEAADPSKLDELVSHLLLAMLIKPVQLPKAVC